jgi:DnaJ-class molecular chaperone
MRFLKSPNAALILAIVYFVFPLDLIPDIFGPFGRLDDLVIFILAIYRVMKDRQQRAAENRAGATDSETHRTQAQNTVNTKSPADPYHVFKLPRGASRSEIDARYKELAKDYHPDRVAHLGEDLRKVAHEKMIEIQKAYDTLSRQVPL